ncbi:hypothetical protein ACTFIN_17130 [Clostridium cagae]|uniref:hypothetical protein n=1 Tax=Clostridium cagae TaxID=2080751 RepID=UPI003F770808
MKGYYISYRCKNKNCNKEMILLTEEVEKTIADGKYISCSHCGSRNIKKETITDNLKECIGHAAYKKEHGRIKQVRTG